MDDTIRRVLFLCTGNSARSILAEAILNRIGSPRFEAYSAGSHPAGQVNPHALALLRRLNYPLDGCRSKSWDEFAAPGAAQMDFVISTCDSAAGEVCPVWPGAPVTAHWGLPDPASVQGNEAEIAAAFAQIYKELSTRLEIFVNLPLDSLDRLAISKRLEAMGKRSVSEA